MAVLSVNPKSPLDSSVFSKDGISGQINYIVETDPGMAPYLVGADPQVPQVGAFISGTFLLIERVEIRAVDPENQWKAELFEVVANYAPPTQEAIDRQVHPLSRPPIPRWTGESVSEIVTKDKDGNVLTNSAGQPVIGGVEDEVSVQFLSVNVNLASFDSAITKLVGKVNSSTFQGYGNREAKFRRADAAFVLEEFQSQLIGYWQVALEFAFDERKWNARYLDVGINEKDGDGNVTRIEDDDGEPIVTPVGLSNGQRAEEPDVLDKEVAKETDFSVFNLPDFS